MQNEIEKNEKLRALNMIWNAARNYDIRPALKVFDEDGHAELYWNSVIGSVYRHYDFSAIDALLHDFEGDAREYELRNLLWLGLEDVVFKLESPARPALESLRKSYARAYLKNPPDSDPLLFERLQRAFYQQILGLPPEPPLTAYQSSLLSALDFDPAMDTDAIVSRARSLFEEYLHFASAEKPDEAADNESRRSFHIPFLPLFGKKKKVEQASLKGGVRRFGKGSAEYSGGTNTERDDLDYHLSAFNVLSEGELREFMSNYFGAPLYNDAQMHTMENALCTGNHETCHLHFTRGDFIEKRGFKGKDDFLKESALRQRASNRAYFEANRTETMQNVSRLTSRIRNSLLVQLQSSVVKSRAGRLNAGRVWRLVKLDDERVFYREIRGDSGDISVDILLDASTSQTKRVEKIAAQAYIIAESLSRCSIPVRVSSFCSLRGFTVFQLFRDYGEGGKNERVFDYFTAGCNRDGLAIRVCRDMLKRSAYEHRMLIILSDVCPNGVQRILLNNGLYQSYADEFAIRDTAAEVRAAEREGVRVLCVFTGEDGALPAAKLVYGSGFTRIRDLDHFADAVGNLIQEQIKNF